MTEQKPVTVRREACPLADSLEHCARNVFGAQVPKAVLLRLAKEARTQAAELRALKAPVGDKVVADAIAFFLGVADGLDRDGLETVPDRMRLHLEELHFRFQQQAKALAEAEAQKVPEALTSVAVVDALRNESWRLHKVGLPDALKRSQKLRIAADLVNRAAIAAAQAGGDEDNEPTPPEPQRPWR